MNKKTEEARDLLNLPFSAASAKQDLGVAAASIGDLMYTHLPEGEVEVAPASDGACIEIVRIMAGVEGRGDGTRAMQAAIEAADNLGVRLTLKPDGNYYEDVKAAEARLREFYERFGFQTIENGEMVRESKRKLPEAVEPGDNVPSERLKGQILEEWRGQKGVVAVTGYRYLAAHQAKAARVIAVVDGVFNRPVYKAILEEASNAGVSREKVHVYCDIGTYTGHGIAIVKFDDVSVANLDRKPPEAAMPKGEALGLLLRELRAAFAVIGTDSTDDVVKKFAYEQFRRLPLSLIDGIVSRETEVANLRVSLSEVQECLNGLGGEITPTSVDGANVDYVARARYVAEVALGDRVPFPEHEAEAR